MLEEGVAQAGDAIAVVERPHPDWSVRRVQHYLYKAVLDEEGLRALAAMELLSESTRKIFRKRIQNLEVESLEDRLVDHNKVEAPDCLPGSQNK
ncbi:MAG: hypothetical protein MO853_09095 [Candidatus Protistobacter heckmanni]|nr:hypothetical protein [Candidatus Protistobacter heckmanni]